jgi:hypothetical protein
VLSGHFRHSQFYFHVIQDRHSSTLERRWLFNLESSRTAFQYSIGAGIWNLLSRDHVLLHALLHCPLAFACAGALFWLGSPVPSPPLQLCAGWVISSFVCFVLTSMKRLRFLGESERYLDFICLPGTLLWLSAFSSSSVLAPGDYLWLGLLSIPVSVIGLYLVTEARSSRRTSPPGSDRWTELWAALGAIGPNATTLTLPHKLSQVCGFRSQAPYAYHQINFSLSEMPPDEFRLLYDRFPRLTDDGASYLLKRYAVERIVAVGKDYETQARRLAPTWTSIEHNGFLFLLRE